MSNSNEPSQFNGNLKSVSGQVQEQIGNLTGATSWQQSGKQQHAEGEAELKAAQAKGYAEGLVDQVGGYKDSIVGAVTGNKSDQIAGNARQEAGAAKKDANAPA
ncbi:mismatched base pair and cruciform DNA recognition protein [Meira miltonrushii]|uniref:Mismatched base pair and cruciform DNA recognition protein n=1 Tax=Meira miltonrushii TaxID=1280837 RepID=A0A316V279_9BASI|nr:mismatched base pair and cruciform DNA recognition protein [Meira miltonrushii]PWN31659.1 mismatched base pair and cruciform DNA recognition protein [Meira miltonrushii]